MLPKHSEQRCSTSRSRRLTEGNDTEGNIYRRLAGGRVARINISAPGRRADAALQLRKLLAAVAAMSANFASML